MFNPYPQSADVQKPVIQPRGKSIRQKTAAVVIALALAAGVGGGAAALLSTNAPLTETASAVSEPTSAPSAVQAATATTDGDGKTGTTSSDDAARPFGEMTQDEIDALGDAEFFSKLAAADIDPDDYKGHQDSTGGSADDSDAGVPTKPIAKVAVDGDTIDTAGLSPEVAKKAQAIWQRFVKLIPADQRRMVSSFELTSGDDQGGHVYQEEGDATKWVLGMSDGLVDLDFVLIHEFGHLLTLQAKEVPPSTSDAPCPTFHTGEGCALKGSTIAEFVGKFWPQDVRDRINSFLENGDDAGLAKYRQETKDQFVSDYAATNPGEDLAETFAIFVLENRPSGDSIADQKVNLLWSDPAMVTLRDQIRAAL